MSKDVLNELRGKDFVPISVVAAALFDGWNRFDVAAALKAVVTDDTTPLMIVDEFGTPEAATDAARDWAIKYLHKCVQKPRLFTSTRVNAKVGWRGVDIANNKYILALLPSAQGEAEERIGWHDAILDASLYFGRRQVTAGEAATLLCNQNPLDDRSDPLLLSTDETNPLDFKRLVRVFNEAPELDAKPRTLMQWLDLAKQNGLKYHSWIDDYISAVERTKGARGLAPLQPSTMDDSAGEVDTGAGTSGVPETDVLESQGDSGVDRNRIIAAFPCPARTTEKNWSKTLSSPPKWLASARVSRGKPSVSALWNPARFAMAYAEKQVMTKANLSEIMRREFQAWLPEWEKYTDSFK